MKKKIRKDKRKIPKGYYCYDHLKKTKKGYKLVGICPYWSKREKRPEQECGHCAYLNKGDWNINAEAKITPIYYVNGKKIKGKTLSGKDMPFFVSLLWDMVKECGINED